MLKVFADRGGTFTDLVVITNNQAIANRLSQDPERFQIASLTDQHWVIIHKLLSEQPKLYQDAVLQGIRNILGLSRHQPIPPGSVEIVKMGTTVATNALLERKGERTLLLITKGFRDALQIGYQNRPDIFARQIVLPEMLYERVTEVEERYTAEGEELIPVNIDAAKSALQSAYDDGIRSCAIVFVHGYRYPDHEKRIATVARNIGFTQVSVSHEVSPLMKLISRGDTTVVDAYLSPILRRYVEQVSSQIGDKDTDTVPIQFMQSNGGLADAQMFQGKDSILSGPAGGIVGAVQTSLMAGFDKIISFDMGGTSTDVAHYNGEYERTFETEIAGVRLRTPMMAIHTVAAGGGSILQFDGARYRVGPESAGANPGPASYSQGGPLTVTDCNVMVGKLQSEFFPKVFGANGDLPLDAAVVRRKFADLVKEIGDNRTPEEVASGFLAIAVEKMASAIKKVSLQRGYDVSKYTLCCFGGAGGQHACLIADALGMKQVFLHPYAGVLSAYGMGLADVRVIRERAVEAELSEEVVTQVRQLLDQLETEGRQELNRRDAKMKEEVLRKVHLRYKGTDSPLVVDFGDVAGIRERFEQAHRQRYGFAVEKALIVEAVSVEIVGKNDMPGEAVVLNRSDETEPVTSVQMYTKGAWHDTPVFKREDLQPGDRIAGPALIIEKTGTNVIEPGWQAELNQHNHLILKRVKPLGDSAEIGTEVDPVLLEIFNNLFRSIAEQMGIILQNTSSSVNIKERLDFSCAIFDSKGQLIANAPHIPVHLGSMSESVRALLKASGDTLKPGDVYASNNPYNGGTHLPDITVITPSLITPPSPLFYVASRGHHADIGGITPGSMPPNSCTVEQEGVLIDNFQLVEHGQLREQELLELLSTGSYPARNSANNLADLRAQIAANERGVQELCKMVKHYGLETVQAYMGHVQDNAEESVRRVIDVLTDGNFTYNLDDGSTIQVAIAIDKSTRSAQIDFTGTSPQVASNFNAPSAVCKAAVLYVFRTLVNDDIPLNAGCLKPLEIIIPQGCLLNPDYPAAVVAGNVETSQAIANALYGALGIMAASQGTMNNFTFGNEQYQYYETIAGGSGAGATFNGTDAVQTHMTNSRLTDPEVLEWRFPVLVKNFAIRADSGGKGQHRGGNGVIRQIQFREAMTAAILSGHRIVPPFGLNGAESGVVGRNSLRRSTGKTELLGSRTEVEMQPGDVFVIETPGGGGFGQP